MWLDDLRRDVQYAIRGLWRDRAFAITVFLTLGIGMAATVAMFTVVEAVLIRPLPFRASDRLVGLTEHHPQRGVMAVTPANFRDIQQRTSVFAALGAVERDRANLRVGNTAQSVVIERLGADVFGALEVTPYIGRSLASRDFEPGADPVALVSHALWQSAFGGSAALVGATIRLGADTYTVVGVLPKQFSLFGDAAVWTPWPPGTTGPSWRDRQFHHFIGIGRLRDGVSIGEARAELRSLAQHLAVEYPATNADWTFALQTLDSMILGPGVRPMVLILMAAACFVLLIGCINVANLLFARATGRHREIAVRLALGCSRSRLTRQLLVESAVLVAGGMIIGTALMTIAVPLLRRIPLATSLPFVPDFHAGSTLGFALLGAFVVATLVAGFAPAWQAYQTGAASVSSTVRAGGAGRHSVRAHQVLIVMEVAITLMLLAGASVLLRSFDRLAHVDLGLAPDHVLAIEITLDDTSYQTPVARAGYLRRVLDSVRSLPGVKTAAIANYTPITPPGFNLRFAIEGRASAKTGDVTTGPLATVSPGFFATLQIPLIRGRLFGDDDVETAPQVLLVNAAFARQFFGTVDPIGHRIRVLLPDANQWRTIVGVIGDVRSAHLEDGPAPTMYAPLDQDPRGNTLLVRTTNAPALAAREMRETLAAIDPNQAVAQVRPLDDVITEARSPSRFRASVVSLFAMFALILAAVGVYGVMSSIITQRTTEWGIRLALGADPHRLLVAIVGRQLKPVTAGTIAGVLGCMACSRLISSFAFEVSALDPLSLATAATAVLCVATVATYLPARRATKTDALLVLRCE